MRSRCPFYRGRVVHVDRVIVSPLRPTMANLCASFPPPLRWRSLHRVWCAHLIPAMNAPSLRFLKTRSWICLLGLTAGACASGVNSGANHEPLPPWNENGRIGHQQLVEKAQQGRIDVYFLGDSITRRWGALDYPEFLAHWQKNFHGWNAGNFGWGGDSTHNMLWRITNGEFAGLSPKVIVLLGGTNNIGDKPRPGAADDTVEGIRALLDTLQAKAPDATIVLTAIFPRNDNPESNKLVAEVNARIAPFADGKRIRFLNINDRLADQDGTLFEGMTVDNLHLSVQGYEIWANALKPVLTELLGEPAAEDFAPPPTGDPSALNKK